MIKLPSDISDPHFDQQFKRGVVIKTPIRFKDGKEKYKYIIILNYDISKDPVVFVLTTSQLEFYDKHPHFNKEIIRIKSGESSIFPKETIINCREVYKITKDKLKKNFRNNILQIEGELTQEILDNINKIIEKSFLISCADKELILGKK
ncbi:MAG: hypothetical protein ABIH18_07930 [Candidatus Omnitrophota bacterium]